MSAYLKNSFSFHVLQRNKKTPPCPQNAGIGCFSLNNTFFGNYSIKTTMNQYRYGKNSKNLICFSIKNVPGGLAPATGASPIVR
jgi:hypothetical protein